MKNLHLRPTLNEIGPTWLGVLMDSLGLNRLSCAFGIGRHSDAQLALWASQRERNAARAFRDAVHTVAQHDKGEAQALFDKWHVVG